MLQLLGGHPVIGAILGAALVALGVATNGPFLVVAGAFVAVMSLWHLFGDADAWRDRGRRRDPSDSQR